MVILVVNLLASSLAFHHELYCMHAQFSIVSLCFVSVTYVVVSFLLSMFDEELPVVEN